MKKVLMTPDQFDDKDFVLEPADDLTEEEIAYADEMIEQAEKDLETGFYPHRPANAA